MDSLECHLGDSQKYAQEGSCLSLRRRREAGLAELLSGLQEGCGTGLASEYSPGCSLDAFSPPPLPFLAAFPWDILFGLAKGVKS